MPPPTNEHLTGVPHATLDTYIDQLAFHAFNLRSGSGHTGPAPPMPAFTLDTARQDTHPPSPSSTLQPATLHARTYGALLLRDIVGDTITRTRSGDPARAKTYGWRLVSSAQIVDPHSVFWFAGLGVEEDAAAGVVYIAIPTAADADADVCETQTKLYTHAHEALARSAWRCSGRGHAKAHGVSVCLCGTRTKTVQVCAKRGGALLAIRVETWVWRPESVGEIMAYAEFARGAFLRGNG